MRRRLPSVLLACSFIVLAACESAEDIGTKAGAEYMGPFIGVAEAQTEGCDKQLETAQTMLDTRKNERALLEPKIAKVKDDEAFKKSFLELGNRAHGGALAQFADKCPEQAARFTVIAKQAADELGTASVLAPWTPPS